MKDFLQLYCLLDLHFTKTHSPLQTRDKDKKMIVLESLYSAQEIG